MFDIINKGITIDPLVATSPNTGSGYVFDGSDAVEVTLTACPAIDNATFRVVRSINGNIDPNFKQEGKPKNSPEIASKLEDLSSIHGIPVNNVDSKMQVFGYVIVPWLEDYYGDIFDVNAIEASCHSFMKNVAQNTVMGKGGIGEEHYKFNGNAYDIKSYAGTSITISPREMAFSDFEIGAGRDVVYAIFEQLAHPEFKFKGYVSCKALREHNKIRNSKFGDSFYFSLGSARFL